MYNINHLYIFHFALLLSGCCFLAGCSNNDNALPEVIDNGESVPLGIKTMRLEGSMDTDTRAGGTSVTTEGATIGVFLTNQGGYTPVYNQTYTCSGGKWSTTDPIYVDKRQGKVIGVYDPNGLVSFAANSYVTSNTLQAQAYDESQLWYLDNTTGANVNNTNAAISFRMISAYSRIKLSIQRHATNYVSGACAISNINLKTNNAFYVNNPLDIPTGITTGGASSSGYDYNPGIASIAVGVTNSSYDVLVPPQSITTNLTITLTIDGAPRSVLIPAAKFTNSALASGKQYTIELLITDTTITMSGSVQINDFATGGSTSSEGEA